VWIDIDDIFPPRKVLIGLQFADPQDFQRAQQLIASDPLLYREVYPYWSMIVVRREDAHRFAKAALPFTEIEQIDDEDLSPEEVARRDRALIDSWTPILFSRNQGRG